MVHAESTLSSPDFASHFVQGLRELWMHGKYCDSEIEVGCRIFKFHRIALAIASPNFLDTKQSLPSDKLVIELPIDTDVQALDAVLHYLYGSDLCVTSEHVDTILKLSCLFKINPITEFCESFKIQNNDYNSSVFIPELYSSDSKKCLSGCLGKKTFNVGSKFPTSVQGLRRGRGRRGLGSGRGHATLTPSRGRGTNSVVKNRGRGKGRGRCRGGRYQSASRKIHKVKLEQGSNLNNAVLSESQFACASNHSREAKQISSLTKSLVKTDLCDNSGAESITSFTKSSDNKTRAPTQSTRGQRSPKSLSRAEIQKAYRQRKKMANTSSRKKYSSGLEQSGENHKPISAVDSILRVCSQKSRGRGAGAIRGRRGKAKLSAVNVPVELTTGEEGYNETSTQLSHDEIKNVRTRLRNKEKQKNYRDRMSLSPEWRKKEADRVKSKYVPVSQLTKKELLLKRQKDSDRRNYRKIRKKLVEFEAPIEMVHDTETGEGVNDEVLMPQNSDIYVVSDLQNINGASTSVAELPGVVIKQEVYESLLDKEMDNSFNETMIEQEVMVIDTIDNEIEYTYNMTENPADESHTVTDDSNKSVIQVALEQDGHEFSYVLDHTDVDMGEINNEFSICQNDLDKSDVSLAENSSQNAE